MNQALKKARRRDLIAEYAEVDRRVREAIFGQYVRLVGDVRLTRHYLTMQAARYDLGGAE